MVREFDPKLLATYREIVSKTPVPGMSNQKLAELVTPEEVEAARRNILRGEGPFSMAPSKLD